MLNWSWRTAEGRMTAQFMHRSVFLLEKVGRAVASPHSGLHRSLLLSAFWFLPPVKPQLMWFSV